MKQQQQHRTRMESIASILISAGPRAAGRPASAVGSPRMAGATAIIGAVSQRQLRPNPSSSGDASNRFL